MPIEDIDHLLQNSIQESIIILVDSSKRNKSIYPKPSEFGVSFDEPFTNVYGVEVLDITVPRTMFMVDENNREMQYKYGFNMLQSTSNVSLLLNKQDYSSANVFFDSVGTQLQHFEIDNDGLTDDKGDHPVLRFFSESYPFLVDMSQSTLKTTLGFDQLPLITDDELYNTMTTILKNKNEININTNFSNAFETKTITSTSYTHNPSYNINTFLVHLKINLSNSDSQSSTITLKYNNSIIITGSLSQNDKTLTLNMTSNDIILDKNNYIIETNAMNIISYEIGYSYFLPLHNINTNNEIYISKPTLTDTLTINSSGNYNSNYSLSNHMNINLDFNTTISTSSHTINSLNITVNSNYSPLDDDKFYLSLYNSSDQLMYDMYLNYNSGKLTYNNNNINDSIFNLAYIQEGYYGILKSKNLIEVPYSSYDSNNNKYNVEHEYNIQFIENFYLKSPGVVNLASENYIVLRCDEIESHLRGSYNIMNDISPGLAVINIDVQGYAQTKNEFISVKYKEFHPIGKLNSLNFRFIRKSDGELYDFKNVNVHFLLSIKFYRPKQQTFFQQSILNTDYDPNYLGYLKRTFEAEEEDSTDDDDIDESYFDNRFIDKENRIKLMLRKHNNLELSEDSDSS